MSIVSLKSKEYDIIGYNSSRDDESRAALTHLRVLYVISWTSRPKSSLAACLNMCSRKPSEPLPSCLTNATSPLSPSLQSQQKLHEHMTVCSTSVRKKQIN